MPIIPMKRKPAAVPPPDEPDWADGLTGSAKERVDKLTARLREMQAQLAETAGLRATNAAQARESAMLRFAAAHGMSEDIFDPEVVEDVGRRFDRHVASEGSKAGTFAEFLTATAAAPPITLRAAFTPVAAPAAAAATMPRPANHNTGIVARQGPPPITSYSAEAVANMTPAQVRANIAAIMAAAAADGEIVGAKPSA